MTASRMILAIAAVASLGTGLGAWSSLAQAQASSGAGATPPAAAAPSTAPSSAAAKSQSVKPPSDAQVESRITQLHRQLKITKDQETDWGAVAQDMRDGAQAMASLLQARNATAQPLNAVDNLKNYGQIVDAQADGLKKITPDFQKLYDEMSPAQKKTADTVFNQRVNARVRTTAAPPSGSKS